MNKKTLWEEYKSIQNKDIKMYQKKIYKISKNFNFSKCILCEKILEEKNVLFLDNYDKQNIFCLNCIFTKLKI